ncbi:MAG: hypothetical protein HY445_02815 [Candidatus Niyogibacteria bacterium]|nr:hypothetical protein [Candidatus Niyogibacteria bacterium]
MTTHTKDILRDLPEFSDDGQRVYEGILSLQKDDERTRRFARRFARAATAFDGGTTDPSQPLKQFILYGSIFAPIPLLVKTASDLWIGMPQDGSLPFTYIDCGAFRSPDRGTLIPLIGASDQAQTAFRSHAILARIDIPHFKARSTDIKFLFDWVEWYLKKFIGTIRRKSPQQFISYFEAAITEQEAKIREEEIKNNGPFKSVIFFDNIQYASAPLQEIIFQILSNGTIFLPAGRISFQNSVIILGMYEEKLSGEIAGFSRTIGKNAAKNYEEIRKELILINPFIHRGAGNLIVVNERTRENQKHRIESELARLREKFKKIDIILEFSSTFIEGFIDQTSEFIEHEAKTIYTESRIISGIERYISNAIARLIAHKELIGGSKLYFDRHPKTNGKQFDIALDWEKGTGEIIVPDDIRTPIDKTIEDRDTWPEWLHTLNSNVSQLLG